MNDMIGYDVFIIKNQITGLYIARFYWESLGSGGNELGGGCWVKLPEYSPQLCTLTTSTRDCLSESILYELLKGNSIDFYRGFVCMQHDKKDFVDTDIFRRKIAKAIRKKLDWFLHNGGGKNRSITIENPNRNAHTSLLGTILKCVDDDEALLMKMENPSIVIFHDVNPNQINKQLQDFEKNEPYGEINDE